MNKIDVINLNNSLKKIDQRLFLLRNRGNGDAVFTRYDAATGTPTGIQLAFIIRRGSGQCKQLDGSPLPASGVHDWGNGWGCAVLMVNLFDNDELIEQFAIVFAAELVRVTDLATPDSVPMSV